MILYIIALILIMLGIGAIYFRNDLNIWFNNNWKKFITLVATGSIVVTGGILIDFDDEPPMPLASVPVIRDTYPDSGDIVSIYRDNKIILSAICTDGDRDKLNVGFQINSDGWQWHNGVDSGALAQVEYSQTTFAEDTAYTLYVRVNDDGDTSADDSDSASWSTMDPDDYRSWEPFDVVESDYAGYEDFDTTPSNAIDGSISTSAKTDSWGYTIWHTVRIGAHSTDFADFQVRDWRIATDYDDSSHHRLGHFIVSHNTNAIDHSYSSWPNGDAGNYWEHTAEHEHEFDIIDEIEFQCQFKGYIGSQPNEVYEMQYMNASPVGQPGLEYPPNGASVDGFDIGLIASVNDWDGLGEHADDEVLDWYIYLEDGDTTPDVLVASGTDDDLKTSITYDASGLEENGDYYWTVKVVDEFGNEQDNTWSFDTEWKPDYGDEDPNDGATGVAIGTVQLRIYYDDLDGDDAVKVEFYDDNDDSLIGTDTSVNDPSDATCDWTGRVSETTYHWYAKLYDDDGVTTTPVFDFTTVGNGDPSASNPYPDDELLCCPIDTNLYFTLSDPENDNCDVCFYKSTGELLDKQTNHAVGVVTSDTINFGCQETIQWYVTMEDDYSNITSDTWSFDTNHFPDDPSNPYPSDTGESELSDVTLRVLVTDSDSGETLDVDFYNDTGDTFLGSDNSISSGGYAEYEWTGLTDGVTYHWFVVVEDDCGDSTDNSDDSWSFTINLSTPPDDPVLVSPANNTELADPGAGTITLNCSYSGPAEDLPYTISYYIGQDGVTPSFQGSNQETTSASGYDDKAFTLDGGHYYTWYTKVKDDQNQENTSTTWRNFTLNNNPAISAITPANDAEVNKDVITEVSCYITDVDDWDYWINTTDVSSNTSGSKSTSSTISDTISSLVYNHWYQWTVEVLDDFGNHQSWGPYNFNTSDAPNSPPLKPGPSDMDPSNETKQSIGGLYLNATVTDGDGDVMTVKRYRTPGWFTNEIPVAYHFTEPNDEICVGMSPIFNSIGQSFYTCENETTLEYIHIKGYNNSLYGNSNGGDLNFTIRGCDGSPNYCPNSTLYSWGSIDLDDWPKGNSRSSATWNIIDMESVTLSANTYYTIVLEDEANDAEESFTWVYSDGTSGHPGYSEGRRCTYTSSWLSSSGSDFNFEVYGSYDDEGGFDDIEYRLVSQDTGQTSGAVSSYWDDGFLNKHNYTWYVNLSDAGPLYAQSTNYWFNYSENTAPILDSWRIADYDGWTNSDDGPLVYNTYVTDVDNDPLDFLITTSLGGTPRDPLYNDYDGIWERSDSSDVTSSHTYTVTSTWTDYVGPVAVKMRLWDGSEYSNIITESDIDEGIDLITPIFNSFNFTDVTWFDGTNHWVNPWTHGNITSQYNYTELHTLYTATRVRNNTAGYMIQTVDYEVENGTNIINNVNFNLWDNMFGSGDAEEGHMPVTLVQILDCASNQDQTPTINNVNKLIIDMSNPTDVVGLQVRPDGYGDSGNWDNDGNIYVTWTPGSTSDPNSGSGIKTFYVEADDSTPDDDAGNDGQHYISSLSEGVHTIYCRAMDNVNLYSDTESDYITIDLTDPVFSIDTIPDSNDGPSSINGNATDNYEIDDVYVIIKNITGDKYWTGSQWGMITGLSASADDGSFDENDDPWYYNNLPSEWGVGEYHISVDGNDAAGNSPASKIYLFNITGGANVTSSADYTTYCNPITLGATNDSAVDNITIYWRESENNATGWSSYVKWDDPSNPDETYPWSWNFDWPDNEGYYELYARSSYNGVLEPAPSSCDIMHRYIYATPSVSEINSPYGVMDPPIILNNVSYAILNVTVSSTCPGDTIDVVFLNWTSNTTLATVNNVAVGEYAEYNWSGRTYGYEYNWYVNLTSDSSNQEASMDNTTFICNDIPELTNFRIENITGDTAYLEWTNPEDILWFQITVENENSWVTEMVQEQGYINISSLSPSMKYNAEWGAGDNLNAIGVMRSFTFMTDGWNPNFYNWDYKRQINISPSAIDYDLEDYAINITLTQDNFNYMGGDYGYSVYPSFKHLLNEGDDFRFTDYYDTTNLTYNISSWSVPGDGGVSLDTTPDETYSTGDWIDVGESWDEDFNSHSTPDTHGTLYYNYTVPAGVLSTGNLIRIYQGEHIWDWPIPSTSVSGGEVRFRSICNYTVPYVNTTIWNYSTSEYEEMSYWGSTSNSSARYFYDSMVTWMYDCEVNITILPLHFNDDDQGLNTGIDANYETKFWMYYGNSSASKGTTNLDCYYNGSSVTIGDEIDKFLPEPTITDFEAEISPTYQINVSWNNSMTCNNKLYYSQNPWNVGATLWNQTVAQKDQFNLAIGNKSHIFRLTAHGNEVQGTPTVECSKSEYESNSYWDLEYVDDTYTYFNVTDCDDNDLLTWYVNYSYNKSEHRGSARPWWNITGLNQHETYYLLANATSVLNTSKYDTDTISFVINNLNPAPAGEITGYTENRPDEKVTISYELSTLDGDASVDCSIQYTDGSSDIIYETTSDSRSSTSQTYTKVINVTYDREYEYRLKIEGTDTNYSDIYSNWFMPIGPFFAGNYIEDDDNNGALNEVRDREYRPPLENTSVELDGNDYYNCGDVDELHNSLTISFWANPAGPYTTRLDRENPIGKAYGGEFAIVFEDDADWHRINYYWGTTGTNSGEGGISYESRGWSNALILDEWHHYCFVRDNDEETVVLYRDGILMSGSGSGWLTPVNGTLDLLIGDGYVTPFTGKMDEVRLYNKALGQTEINYLVKGANISSDHLIGHWSLNDATECANDLVGGWDGTAVGNPTDTYNPKLALVDLYATPYEQYGYIEGSDQEEDWMWIETNITEDLPLTINLSLMSGTHVNDFVMNSEYETSLIEGFEAALDPAIWGTYHTNNGRSNRNDTSHKGNWAYYQDAYPEGTQSLNELYTVYDFTGATEITLDFWQLDKGDEEDHPAPDSWTGHGNYDAVAYTNDGITWYEIVTDAQLNNAQVWEHFNVVISNDPDFISPATSDFSIKFQQQDNYDWPDDGRIWDDINITYNSSAKWMQWYNVTGLSTNYYTFHITNNSGDVVLNWTKPGPYHRMNESRQDESKYVKFGATESTDAMDYRVMYMNPFYYDTSAYRYTINNGYDLYEAMSVTYWGQEGTGIPDVDQGNKYDRGQLFGGGIINGENQDTGFLSDDRIIEELGSYDGIYENEGMDDNPQRHCFSFTAYWLNESTCMDTEITNWYFHFWEQEAWYSTYLGRGQSALWGGAHFFDWNPDDAGDTRDWVSVTASEIDEYVGIPPLTDTIVDSRFNVQKTDNTTFNSTYDQYLMVGFHNLSTPFSLNNDSANNFGVIFDGRWPNQQIGEYQQGFVVFNLPSYTVLQGLDSDSDGLNDYEELFFYYTNPKHEDTDEDGFHDGMEVNHSTDPNLYTSINIAPEIRLVNPPNETTGQELVVTLTWEGLDDTGGDLLNYYVYFGDDPDPDYVAHKDGYENYTTTTLDFNTKYFWYIIASDENLTTTSDIWNFTTRPRQVPNPPTNFEAIPDGIDEIDLYWSNGLYGSYTWLEWNTSADWPKGEGNFLTNTSNTYYSHSGLTHNTQYYYQAWAWNSVDNEYSITNSSCDATTALDDPPYIYGPNPTNNTISDEQAFSWSVTIGDALSNVDWWINCSNGQQSYALNDSSGSKEVSLSGLTFGVKYRVYVNVSDNTTWTRKWFDFTIRSGYTPVINYFNANAISRVTINISTDVNYLADWYILENNSISDWSLGAGNQLMNTTSSNGYNHTGLDPSTLYYYKLFAYNMTDDIWGTSTCSETTLANNIPDSFSPNPANNSYTESTSLDWYVWIEDADGENFAWNISCSNGQSNDSASDTDGVKELKLTDLDMAVEYKIWVNMSDIYSSSTDIYYINIINMYVPYPPGSFQVTSFNKSNVNLSWVTGAKADKTRIEYDTDTSWVRGSGELVQETSATTAIIDDLQQGTLYYFQAWSYNETGGYYNESYSSVSQMTTGDPVQTVSNPTPVDDATQVAHDLDEVSILLFDTDATGFTYWINGSFFTNIEGFISDAATHNISRSIPSDLNYNTLYTWTVETMDVDERHVDKEYSFRTEYPGHTSYLGTTPINGSTGVNLTPTFKVHIDSDDVFYWLIKASNGQSNTASDASSGIKELSMSGLAYSTEYKVWVNSSVDGNWTREWFTFTTLGAPTPLFTPPTTGIYNVPVAFTDSSTGIITDWTWKFGDSTTSNDQNPIHVYEHPGRYSVILELNGDSVEVSHNVDIGSMISTRDGVDYFVWTGDNKTLNAIETELGATTIERYREDTDVWTDVSATVTTYDILKSEEELSIRVAPNEDLTYSEAKVYTIGTGLEYAGWVMSTPTTIKTITVTNLGINSPPSYAALWDDYTWFPWMAGITPDPLDRNVYRYDVIQISNSGGTKYLNT